MPEPGWVPIFYGEPSRDMWDRINSATSKAKLRRALYIVCCRLQELESRLEKRERGLSDGPWSNVPPGKHSVP